MFQVYFLSVLTNIFVGLFLINENKIEDSQKFSSKKPMITLILGLVTLIVGIVKLFVVAQPDIVFIGDLLPSIAGICGGLCLIINYLILYSKNQINLKPMVQKIFVDWKKIIGFSTLVIGILHFIIPQVRVF